MNGGRIRVWAWPLGRPAALADPFRLPRLSQHARSVLDAVRAAIAVESAPGRLIAWMPVAFCCGIALYFAAEREPSLIATGLLALAATTAAFLVRRHGTAFAAAILIAAASSGFAVVTFKTAIVAHPVLDRPAYGVAMTGFVERREERERSDRIVLRVTGLSGDDIDTPLERVRLSLRRGTAPAVGTHVALKARLNPPLPPLRPGGYDFARDLYYQGIGAIGFVAGAIKVEPALAAPDRRLRFLSFIDALRDGIDQRIRAVVPGDAGAIASALITGKRDALSAPVNDALYVSGLAHILSISGYHMAVVAGVVFFGLRAGLALVPGLALRRPIKKWAALAALLAATFYLLLSGAEVATQRAYIMIAIVLIGITVDRAALTLRNLALAALAVMLIAPEAVVHPGFQMSFAATLALVAIYQGGVRWSGESGRGSLRSRAAAWGLREVMALLLASLVAGLATTPYAAFHFHRLAPYGVLANLLATPIVSFWVMPAGLLALAASPFGFDGPIWRLMGDGIEWMNAVALWVAGLPGAVGRIPAFEIGALLLASVGLVAICLLRSWLRYAGIVLVLISVWIASRTPRPDVLVSANADAVAVRTAGGRLAIVRTSSNPLAVRDWLSADGDARGPNDARLNEGFACDPAGCIARLPDGSAVSVARTAHGVAEDCREAAVVITSRVVPPACGALALDRHALREGGALTLQRTEAGWTIARAVPPNLERPWTAKPAERKALRAVSVPPASDATRLEDLED
jgi:competence protein ComEC